MAISLPFRPKLLEALTDYSGAQFRRDFMAGLNVMTVAFPLSMAFAIASGVRPEQGLFTAIIGGGIIAALGGSRVQIGGPTGAFVIITYSVLQGNGLNGLLLCTMMAGAMLCVMGFARLGSIIRNVRSGARTPFAGISHSALLLVVLLAAAPMVSYIPLGTLSAILVVAAYRMVSWKQFARLTKWPLSDSSVFVATFGLTVLTNLTLAVEVGVVLASLLMVKRISETSRITAVDEATETEGSHHSLVGKEVPDGVLVFRVFGAFFFGVVDKLDDELKRAKQEPDVLILRVRKVLAIDATGLQALEDLHAKLRAKGKHLLLSAPHTQPLAAMENAGFIDRIGRENVCPHITAALARAREILGLPPVVESLEPHEALHAEKRELDTARRELSEVLERTNRVLNRPTATARTEKKKDDEAA